MKKLIVPVLLLVAVAVVVFFVVRGSTPTDDGSTALAARMPASADAAFVANMSALFGDNAIRTIEGALEKSGLPTHVGELSLRSLVSFGGVVWQKNRSYAILLRLGLKDETVTAQLGKMGAEPVSRWGKGHPGWKLTRGHVVKLGEGTWATGTGEGLDAVVAAWDGKAPRMMKSGPLSGYLGHVRQGGALLAAGRAPEAMRGLSGVGGGALSIRAGRSVDAAVFLDAPTSLARKIEAGVTAAKLMLKMGDPSMLLGRDLGDVGIDPEKAKLWLEAAAELMENLEVEAAEGGITLRAHAKMPGGLTLGEMVADLVAGGVSAAKQAHRNPSARPAPEVAMPPEAEDPTR